MFGWLFCWTFWKWAVIINALLGPLLLHMTLNKLRKHRKVDEERDAKFPQWRRYDNKDWSWTLYLGAATIMIPRILFFVWITLTGSLISASLLWSLNVKSGDIIQGPRKTMSDYNYHYGGYMLMLAIGVIPDVRRPTDCDYSKWLGPGYKHIKTTNPKGWPSCVVANHMGFMDINIIAWTFAAKVGYAASTTFEFMPVVGFMCRAVECIFVPRGSTPEALQKCVEVIEGR